MDGHAVHHHGNLALVDLAAALGGSGIPSPVEQGEIHLLQLPDIPGIGIQQHTGAAPLPDGGGEQLAEDGAVVLAPGHQNVDLALAQLVNHPGLGNQGVLRHGVNLRADAGEGRSEDHRVVGQAVDSAAQCLVPVAHTVQHVGENSAVQLALDFVQIVFHKSTSPFEYPGAAVKRASGLPIFEFGKL